MKKFAIAASLSALVIAGCTPTTQEAAAPQASTPATPTATANAPRYGTFGFDTAGMDRAVQPGDDFYGYANGTWARSTAIPADRSNYGMFTVLEDLSRERTRAILDEQRGNADSKIGRAYASFLNEAAVEAKGMAPITPWLNRIRALNDKAAYPTLAAEADRAGIASLFGAYVGQDDRNPDRYIVSMYQSGLGMPDRDYYLEQNEHFQTIRASYMTFLEQMLTLAGETNAHARAQAVMDFETRVARAHWTQVESRDATKTYNKLTIADLVRRAPGYDFPGFLRGIGVTQTEVLVAQPTAFTGIAAAYADAPLPVLRDQLIIRSLSTYADQLPRAVSQADFAFYGTALSGTPQQQERWKRAVDFTENVLADDLSQVYVERHFPPETKAAMDQLVRNVLAALDRRIDTLEWMQPQTKRRAKAKLANFTVKIGYPSQWRSYADLDIRADDLFGNAWRSANFEHNYAIGKLGTPVRRWEWGMTPMTINAYANFAMNEIVFPAAILQPPFFDPNADPAINYGGIGAVIGHEISHHFDDQGSKYDENGRLSDWWTPQDLAAFQAAGRRLIEQYNGYEVLGQHVNGELTQGENIGDLAGLSIAYDAYKRSLNGAEAPVIDGTTGDQRFFMGWAQVWRRNYRDANLRQRLTTDPHSPSEQRAWVVRNLDPWYTAFDVQAGRRLYLAPQDRVRIW
jgi:putative endopeptidase